MLREKAKTKGVGHGWDYVDAAGTAVSVAAARSCISPSAAGKAPAAVPVAGTLPAAAVPLSTGTRPAPAVDIAVVLPHRSSHRIRRRSSCCPRRRR